MVKVQQNALLELVQDEDMSNGVDVVSDFLVLSLRNHLWLHHQLAGAHWRLLSHVV